MKVTRRQLRSALESVAERPAPAADPFFVEALEQRLTAGRIGFEELRPIAHPDLAGPSLADSYLAPVIPLRRTRPLVGAAAAILVLGIGTVAVAAPWQRSSSRVRTAEQVDLPTPSIAPPLPSTSVGATFVPTTTLGEDAVARDQTTDASTSIVIPATNVPATNLDGGSSPTTATAGVAPSASAGGTTAVAVSTPTTIDARPQPATTRGPTTVSPSSAPATTLAPTTTAPPVPTTSAVTTVASTSTTEVSVPAALTINCTVISSTSVRCTWSRSTDAGVAGYRILRGVASGPGRVFSTGPGDLSSTDTIAQPGTDYTYLVHAVRADGSSIAHSQAVAIHCCTPG